MRRIAEILAGLLLGSACFAASPRELIEQGNEHYAAGRYEEALEAYQEAAEAGRGEPSAELLHDQAAAQFKLGKIDEARELWVRALSLKDAAFEARMRYNLGNCSYADALKLLQAQNGQGVMEAVGRAIEQYRDALRLDPGLEMARANLELTYQLKQKLEQNSTTQPSSQPSTQPSDKQNQKSSTQPSENQQGQKGEPNEPEQDKQQSSTQPSSQPDEKYEPPSSQPDQQEQPPPSTQPTTQPQPSTQPDDSGAQSQPAQQPQPQEGQGEQSEQQPMSMIKMTREQAERLLQQIRDAEKARRKALLQREAAKQPKVDRDW